MYDRMLCTLQCVKRLADDMLSRLCEYLNRHIIRDQILLDQRAEELILGIGSCRETDLDFLKTDLYEELEELYLLLQRHRNDEGLIAISQIHAAPYRCMVYIFFLSPLHAADGWHKILANILVVVHHNHFLLFSYILKASSRIACTRKKPPPEILSDLKRRKMTNLSRYHSYS